MHGQLVASVPGLGQQQRAAGREQVRAARKLVEPPRGSDAEVTTTSEVVVVQRCCQLAGSVGQPVGGPLEADPLRIAQPRAWDQACASLRSQRLLPRSRLPCDAALLSTTIVKEAASSQSPARLEILSTHRDKAVRAAVAQNPATPTPVLLALLGDKHFLPRYGVAENPDPRAWAVALQASDSGVRVMLAQRQDLDARTIQVVLGDAEREVRQSLAWSTKHMAVLARLARDEHKLVRADAALNGALSEDDLELLPRDRVANVRACAAQSTRLRPETVLRLAQDRSYMPRYEILLAPPDRRDVAEFLQHDTNALVAHLARGRLNQRLPEG
jgi:hypothetical protein